MTDEHPVYRHMSEYGFEHKTIKHTEKVYAKGDVHTQTIENFWMTLKGGLRGVYHGVGNHNLQSYIDEYAFRYNRRWKGHPMFRSFLDRGSRPLEAA